MLNLVLITIFTSFLLLLDWINVRYYLRELYNLKKCAKLPLIISKILTLFPYLFKLCQVFSYQLHQRINIPQYIFVFISLITNRLNKNIFNCLRKKSLIDHLKILLWFPCLFFVFFILNLFSSPKIIKYEGKIYFFLSSFISHLYLRYLPFSHQLLFWQIIWT